MAVELKIPPMGESITEVLIGEWHKGEGDAVQQDEPVVELESDKATVDLPAPAAGTITKVLKAAGQTAAVGEVIGLLEAGATTAGNKAATKVPAAEAPAKATPHSGTKKNTSATKAGQPERSTPTEPAGSSDGARIMPAARRVLAEQGIEAAEVQPSGPGGRLLKEDVLKHAEFKSQETAANDETAGAHGEPVSGMPAREEEAIPMSPLRRRVAQRLVEAQQTAALLTTFNEADMSAVMALRKQHQEAFQARYQVKLGFMSFFVKAVVEALKQSPAVNAEVRGSDIVYRNYYDIGIAVGGGKGLVVPVLRNAERLSFAEVEQKVADFGLRAQANKITLEELQGGTFTISNGGIYGSLLSTPIVNPPQSGILGMHAIQDRPVARDGAVVIRPMMYLALTYDHRVVDGREAVTFLKRIKDLIESPAVMLLEV